MRLTKSQRRFRELMLYLAKRSQGDPRFGATKLNKQLLYCELRSIQKFGKPMTKERYQKLPKGPAPRSLPPVVQEMEDQKKCVVSTQQYYGYTQKRLVPLVEPDLTVFTAEEIDLVNSVLEELWEQDGTQVSDLSHKLIGWELAEMKEDIPLGTILVGEPRELGEEEQAFARSLVGRVR